MRGKDLGCIATPSKRGRRPVLVLVLVIVLVLVAVFESFANEDGDENEDEDGAPRLLAR